MPTTLSDHALLSQGDAILVETNDVNSGRFIFAPPNDFVPGTRFAKPVLFFMAKPTGSTNLNIYAGNSVLADVLGTPNLFVKQYEIGTGDNDDEQWRTIHQALNGNRFRPHPRTQIVIAPVRGRVQIQQVMLMFQRTVDA